jgi:hypothetical protein
MPSLRRKIAFLRNPSSITIMQHTPLLILHKAQRASAGRVCLPPVIPGSGP